MVIMAYTFGFTLATEYFLLLTNLNSVNSPMEFPTDLAPYPVKNEELFLFPWFFKIDFLKNNLNWTVFFGIDIDGTGIKTIWFDFCNLVLLTIYFFNYGNPINAKDIKVSFSKTRSLEDDLDHYSRLILK